MESHAPSEQIIRTVAEREGVDPVELPPLFDAVDPDALDRLAERDVTITFTYMRYQVAVRGGGRPSVSIQLATDSAPAQVEPDRPDQLIED